MFCLLNVTVIYMFIVSWLLASPHHLRVIVRIASQTHRVLHASLTISLFPNMAPVAAKWVATAKMCCHSMCNVPVCTLGVVVHCTGVFRHIGRKPTVVVRRSEEHT